MRTGTGKAIRLFANPSEDAWREDKRLDVLYGPDRPKCRICGGRKDHHTLFTRCLYCGTSTEHEEGA